MVLGLKTGDVRTGNCANSDEAIGEGAMGLSIGEGTMMLLIGRKERRGCSLRKER
jgi:hypothetical protein